MLTLQPAVVRLPVFRASTLAPSPNHRALVHSDCWRRVRSCCPGGREDIRHRNVGRSCRGSLASLRQTRPQPGLRREALALGLGSLLRMLPWPRFQQMQDGRRRWASRRIRGAAVGARVNGQSVAEPLRPFLQSVAEGGQKGVIKPLGACDVICADCHVGNHPSYLFAGRRGLLMHPGFQLTRRCPQLPQASLLGFPRSGEARISSRSTPLSCL